MSIGWDVLFLLAIPLEFVVVVTLLRGPLKDYGIVFVYLVLLIVSSILEALSYLNLGLGKAHYSTIYWSDDLILHGLVILTVIALTRKALRGASPLLPRVLLFGTVAFAVGSMLAFYSPTLGRWMTPVSRNLSFCEEVLNLILWAILVRQEDHDPILLLVSAGLGIQVTGEVIGHTLRLYSDSRTVVWIPDVLTNIAQFSCLVIWIWAFHRARRSPPSIVSAPAN
jgi:hypothetical protein